jgi:phospholipid/cholesterol/gamma-HCH transport system ATP-binding protein
MSWEGILENEPLLSRRMTGDRLLLAASGAWTAVHAHKLEQVVESIEREGVALTALENIAFPMREYLAVSERLRNEVAAAKLEMVGLTPADGTKLPSELSGGMAKRVALARALALDPEIVFLDEPTSGLDPISAGEFDALIRTLQETLGLTVLMITHDLESLHSIANRIAALADGKVVAVGPMASMLASEHPWVKKYFQGQRARLMERRMAQPVS